MASVRLERTSSWRCAVNSALSAYNYGSWFAPPAPFGLILRGVAISANRLPSGRPVELLCGHWGRGAHADQM